MDTKHPRSKGPSFLGKLRATTNKKDEYFLFGPGENPSRVKAHQEARKAFLLCKFEEDIIEGLGKVKKTLCVLPNYTEDPKGKIRNYDGVIDPHDLGISKDHHVMKNKKPRWSKSKQKYVFKFGPRVKEPSNKNTQLIEEIKDANNIVFQLGKYDKSTFNLDVQSPFSIFQAFGLCLAICDTS